MMLDVKMLVTVGGKECTRASARTCWTAPPPPLLLNLEHLQLAGTARLPLAGIVDGRQRWRHERAGTSL